MFTRYAIYHTPAPDSALAALGAAWLGWDSATGRAVAHPETTLDLDAITATPRRYGFHATIKPPFRLADGSTETGLRTALAELCAELVPARLDGLRLARLGRFLALVPVGEAPGLEPLAERTVRDLDRFRAPPDAAELARRRTRRLNPVQEAHLTRWGYPYVLDQFRFHMTLTGRLDPATADAAEGELTDRIATVAPSPYRIDSLTLLGEDADGWFHQIERHRLSG